MAQPAGWSFGNVIRADLTRTSGTPGMTEAIEKKVEEAPSLRAHYEMVAYKALWLLWHGKWLIAATTLAFLLIAVAGLAMTDPRYTSEAVLQFDFNREEPANGTKSTTIATLETTALIDGQVRIIRSRATANAVVTRLGLETDPRFAHQSVLSRGLATVRSALGHAEPSPTARDLAIEAVMRMVRVTNEPRSYLISVGVTSDDPEKAANLANTVVLEYLRGQALREMAGAETATRRALDELSATYGTRHPTILRVQTRLEQLRARLKTLRDAVSPDDVMKLAEGPPLLSAEKVLIPSSPNISVVLALAVLAGLIAGIVVVRCMDRYSDKFPVAVMKSAVAALRLRLASGHLLALRRRRDVS